MTLGLMPNIENKEKKRVGEGGREEKEKGGMEREGRKEGKGGERGEVKGGEGREGEERIKEERKRKERGERKKRQRTWAKAGTSFSLGHSHKSHLCHSLFFRSLKTLLGGTGSLKAWQSEAHLCRL